MLGVRLDDDYHRVHSIRIRRRTLVRRPNRSDSTPIAGCLLRFSSNEAYGACRQRSLQAQSADSTLHTILILMPRFRVGFSSDASDNDPLYGLTGRQL